MKRWAILTGLIIFALGALGYVAYNTYKNDAESENTLLTNSCVTIVNIILLAWGISAIRK